MKDYKIIRKAISPDLAEFLYNYFKLKRKISKLLFDYHIISPLDKEHGVFGDTQTPSKNTYCLYGDPAFETLLTKLKPLMEKETKQKLIETYAYGRIYQKGDVLKSHTDRPNCAFSTTISLGGAVWPFYMEDKDHNTLKIILKPGDMLVYQGDKFRHWRYELKEKECGQIFLHYIREGDNNPNAAKYDFRPSLGLTLDQSLYLQSEINKRRNENN